MESLQTIRSFAAPLLRINVDTDQITPGPFMVRAYKEGWASALFGNWRFMPDGSLNPDFILNKEPWNTAQILLTGRNFGCGSSREIAAKALRDFGFRVIIAPSFAGIFYNNCFRNGLLPVIIDEASVARLAKQMEASRGADGIKIDLEIEEVTGPDGEIYSFSTPTHLRQMLLQGLDEIGFTLTKRAEMEQFWTADAARRPWVYPETP